MEIATVDRAFIRVTGEEAAAYLQGQLSQDIAKLGVGNGALSFLLEPTGKVVALLRVLRRGHQQYELIVDEQAAEAVVVRLRRYLLRTKAEVGDASIESCTMLFDAAPVERRLPVVLWPGEPMPQEVMGLDPAVHALAEDLPPYAYEQRRVAAGVPVSGVDIGPDTIPGEVGRWAIEAAVSFTKGCYTGQELVARIDSRGGNVPRPLRAVVVADDSRGGLLTGDEVVVDGKPVGRLTSAAGRLAMGPIARAVVPPAPATVDGRSVEVRELPVDLPTKG